MAGYVTDDDIRNWRHARHPLRYDPPRLGDYVKTAAGIMAFCLLVYWFLWTIDSVIPSYMW